MTIDPNKGITHLTPSQETSPVGSDESETGKQAPITQATPDQVKTKLGQQLIGKGKAATQKTRVNLDISAKKILEAVGKFSQEFFPHTGKEPKPEEGAKREEIRAFTSMLEALDMSELEKMSDGELKTAFIAGKREMEAMKLALSSLKGQGVKQQTLSKSQSKIKSEAVKVAKGVVKASDRASFVYLAEVLGYQEGDPVWTIASGFTAPSEVSGMEGNMSRALKLGNQTGALNAVTGRIRLCVKKKAMSKNKAEIVKLKQELKNKENSQIKGQIKQLELKVKAQGKEIKKIEKKLLKAGPLSSNFFSGSVRPVETPAMQKIDSIAFDAVGAKEAFQEGKKLDKEVKRLDQAAKKIKKSEKHAKTKKKILSLRKNHLRKYQRKKGALNFFRRAASKCKNFISTVSLRKVAIHVGLILTFGALFTGAVFGLVLGVAIITGVYLFARSHRNRLNKGRGPTLQKFRARRAIQRIQKKMQQTSLELFRKKLEGKKDPVLERQLQSLSKEVVKAENKLSYIRSHAGKRKVKDHAVGKEMMESLKADIEKVDVDELQRFAQKYCVGLNLKEMNDKEAIYVQIAKWITSNKVS